jgi:hydrogenase expression/formation protein HypC
MCLGVPGCIVEAPTATSDPARVQVDGVVRDVDLSLLEGAWPVAGEWVLVHLGFALERLTPEQAAEVDATRRMLARAGPALESVS